jgi:SAM-dependent methyltransferase
MIPDWQLPAGVDRGLWDYLHAADMVAGYDETMRASALARADVAFCARAFPTPGKLLDLGCGTGRLCAHFAPKGYECVGLDLSDDMLAQARANAPGATFVKANIADPLPVPDRSFDYGACLFSTLGMVRGAEHRTQVLQWAHRALKPGAVFVLHAHNRFYRGLGRKRVWGQRLKTFLLRESAGDITMPQAYGGAPLTLYHYTRHIAERLLDSCGFRVQEVLALGADGEPARGSRVYGWLLRAARP